MKTMARKLTVQPTRIGRQMAARAARRKVQELENEVKDLSRCVDIMRGHGNADGRYHLPIFSSGSNPLNDLLMAVYSARKRIELGEDRDFGAALHGVLTDYRKVTTWRKPTGKFLGDWVDRRGTGKPASGDDRATAELPLEDISFAV